MTDRAASDDSVQFLVRRDDLRQTAFLDAPSSASITLAAGEVLLAVDCFAFTSNNITYGVFGDAMQYWNFFPAREGWGIIPVWGFATVERSAHPEVAEGERIYGYLPMASHFVVKADRVSEGGFTDASAHRSELAAIYNSYVRAAGDPGYDPRREAEQMLFRPLFMTAFLLDDFLADAGFFGAKSVVLSSASSKTSMGLAFCLSRRGREHCEVVGLTSRSNVAFVEGLGCYHRVVAYDDIASMPTSTPTVFVDMAGDAGVTSAMHHHFGDALKYSCQVGGTHWEKVEFGASVPGPTPTLFFAPSQIAKRLEDWGPAGYQKRVGEAWAGFLPQVDGSITVDRSAGREAVERVYRETLEGRADPRRGFILSLN
jgi:hypothetical protein